MANKNQIKMVAVRTSKFKNNWFEKCFNLLVEGKEYEKAWKLIKTKGPSIRSDILKRAALELADHVDSKVEVNTLPERIIQVDNVWISKGYLDWDMEVAHPDEDFLVAIGRLTHKFIK